MKSAKNNSKLTDFEGLKDVVIDHMSKVRQLPKQTKMEKNKDSVISDSISEYK